MGGPPCWRMRKGERACSHLKAPHDSRGARRGAGIGNANAREGRGPCRPHVFLACDHRVEAADGRLRPFRTCRALGISPFCVERTCLLPRMSRRRGRGEGPPGCPGVLWGGSLVGLERGVARVCCGGRLFLAHAMVRLSQIKPVDQTGLAPHGPYGTNAGPRQPRDGRRARGGGAQRRRAAE